MLDQVMTALTGDATLVATLTGGIYDGRTVMDVSRQGTPDAYDDYLELLPTALVRASTETPFGGVEYGHRLYFSVWLYARASFAALETARLRIFTLLHRQQLAGATGLFEIRHDADLLGLEAPGIEAAMVVCNYYAARSK